MESSIAEFLLWMCACEPHPTSRRALIPQWCIAAAFSQTLSLVVPFCCVDAWICEIEVPFCRLLRRLSSCVCVCLDRCDN